MEEKVTIEGESMMEKKVTIEGESTREEKATDVVTEKKATMAVNSTLGNRSPLKESP